MRSIRWWLSGMTTAACLAGCGGASTISSSGAGLPNAAATLAARRILDSAVVSPIEGPPCSTVRHGKVGPLTAPVYWCAFPNGANGVIKYSSDPDGNYGIAYHPGSFATLDLDDDCVLGLGEGWWMYQRVGQSCPDHYQLISGP
jgi:hypothetical protein